MGDIFSQLGHLFLQAIPTVIFVFLLFLILERIFFRPLLAVMKKRDDASAGAMAGAREQAGAAETKAREYEEAFQATRQEVYRQREAARRTNLAERDAALQKARQQTEKMIREAQVALDMEVERAKTELDRACLTLAEEISQSLVGPASPTGSGGAART